MTESTARAGVKSAARTVELLEYLAARQDEPARIREISEDLGMPRSSAHALLRTLMAQGWVRADETGTLYGIGIRALLVGTSYLDGDPYLPMIAPFLDDLRSDWDETFHLGRLDGTDIVYKRFCHIGVAVGTDKVDSIVAGARGGYFNQLVTDPSTAAAILQTVTADTDS